MGLADHLIEFRNRFIICLVAIVIAMVVGFVLSGPALDLIRRPIEDIARERAGRVSINFNNVTSGFDLRLQMALTLGIVIASPVWLYQVWMFLMPGLKKTERRYALGFLGAAIPLFLAGVITGLLVQPRIVEVMTSFVPFEDTVFYDAKTYYSFVLTLCLAVGIAYIVPVLLVMLNVAGILTGKQILGGWRWAVLITALFAALATPAADVISMLLLMVPMVLLYFVAAGISAMFDRGRVKRRQRIEREIEADLATAPAAVPEPEPVDATSQRQERNE